MIDPASTMHYIDHVKIMSSYYTEPTFPSSSTVLVPTIPPRTDEHLNWVPYAIAGSAVLSLFILVLCCCCRSLRDLCICCCFIRRGNKLMTPSAAQLDPKFDSRVQPQVPSIVTVVSSHSPHKPSTNSLDRTSGHERAQGPIGPLRPEPVRSINTQVISLKTSVPSRQQIANSVKTQKYIGNLLSGSRRSKQSSSTKGGPSAIVQVARTQKIIGNILAKENSQRNKN